MEYQIKELSEFLVVTVSGNMTADDNPVELVDVINENMASGRTQKLLFNLESVEDIDDDGIDVFISCLSLQNINEDKDIEIWAKNLDDKKIDKTAKTMIAKPVSNEDEYGDMVEDLMNLGDVYKEGPNAPMTDCFALVKDDDVYDKLYEAGVAGLMTIYRTREDFTLDHGVKLAK